MIVGLINKNGKLVESPLRLQDSQIARARALIKKGEIADFVIATLGEDDKLHFEIPKSLTEQQAEKEAARNTEAERKAEEQHKADEEKLIAAEKEQFESEKEAARIHQAEIDAQKAFTEKIAQEQQAEKEAARNTEAERKASEKANKK
ncbi:hypothetical protein FACS1894151_08130 [Spirochaetia bacterium]|nr:hypothetical protein FACS1894151_08130 [Spirochaetia bacterium]